LLDVRHVFSLSLIQTLRFDRVRFLQPVSKKTTAGWQYLNITSITSGSPFTVFSGIQRTGAAAGGTDRPDLVSMPDFSTKPDFAKAISVWAQITIRFSRFRSRCRTGVDRTMAVSECSAATRFAARASGIWTWL
jgi:hypothetical protein